MNKGLQKLIVILGPTASGKTEFGIKVAKEFNGEVISADSRQIYKKMLIGTAKPRGEWVKHEGVERYLVEGVPHYLVDILDPGKTYTVADFKSMALEKVDDIVSRGKIPIIVGGTGLYIWSLIDNLSLPPGLPNKKLRESFEAKEPAALAALLFSLDPAAAELVDIKNKRRLIRALEVAITTGESFVAQRSKAEPIFDSLQLGLAWPTAELNARIENRIDQQWNEGLVFETENLLRQNYSFELPSMSSIGYREVGAYLRGEATEEEAKIWFKRSTKNYAKRQITWFKKDKRIHWIHKNDYHEGRILVQNFLRSQSF